jgi:hypothetical protein
MSEPLNRGKSPNPTPAQEAGHTGSDLAEGHPRHSTYLCATRDEVEALSAARIRPQRPNRQSITTRDLFRNLWISCRYKNATLHIGDNISNLNRMAKRGWRVQKIETVRVGWASGSFRDYFQAQIINKSILGFFAPKNSHKVIGETPVFIGGGSLNSECNQSPSQFGAGGQIPFVGNDDSVKLDKFSEVDVGVCIHKGSHSANSEPAGCVSTRQDGKEGA